HRLPRNLRRGRGRGARFGAPVKPPVHAAPLQFGSRLSTIVTALNPLKYPYFWRFVSTATLKILFNLLALALACALAFVLAAPGAMDDGIWRSLAQGRLIAEGGGFPAWDPFNFSLPAGTAFDKDGWLFSLASYGLHQFAG